jgi:hypothetical protein
MENRNKKIPEKFTLTDNQRVILEFEKLLRDCGLKINGTPLEEAWPCLDLVDRSHVIV